MLYHFQQPLILPIDISRRFKFLALLYFSPLSPENLHLFKRLGFKEPPSLLEETLNEHMVVSRANLESIMTLVLNRFFFKTVND
jgi:hypothetical protein